MRRRISSYLFVAAATIGFPEKLPASMPSIDAVPPLSTTSGDAAQGDSLGSLLRRLEPMIAPVAAGIDSMVNVLRPDSATVRADSAFMRARQTLQRLVWAIRVHEDSVFQRMAVPVGARAGRDPPATRDIATADSLTRNLDARGLWVSRGEGQAWLALSESSLFRRLGRFLTESTQEYQRILVDEQTSPTGADASLMVSWDSLGERLARTERFLATYPNTASRDEVVRLYDGYLRWYVLGSDNTKAFDWRTCVLEFEVHRSYERYAADHAFSPSGKIVRGYLDVLRRNRFQYGDAVRKYLLANTDWSPRARGCRR